MIRKSWKTLICLLAVGFSACDKESGPDAPLGTEVENEVVGRLYLAGGKPAVGAKVRLYPVNWSPKPDGMDAQGSYLTLTDAKGEFRLDSLKNGEYNILGSLDTLASYQDSLIVSGNTKTLDADTLGPPGSITGYIALQPNHLASTATVEILGTQYYTNVSETGEFRFSGLAAGAYSIRVSTTLPQYTQLYSGFRIRTGSTDTLADTLRMAFTGIPVITGLRVDYDTLNGVARVSWSPVKYALLQDYALFRDNAQYTDLSPLPIVRLRDTVYRDTLFPRGGGGYAALQDDSFSLNVEYRVKARNISDDLGANFRFVALHAPSPAWVRTFLDLELLDTTDGVFSRMDSARVVLRYRNKTRSNDSLAWFPGSGNTPIRVRADLGFIGEDTLVFATAAKSGPAYIKVVMKDEAGSKWETTLSYSVIDDKPIVFAGRDSIVSAGLACQLRGSATQRFGSISKWEWDIGNRGSFIRTSGPDTIITMPAILQKNFQCVLRATDDDGFIGLDTISFTVTSSLPLAFPERGASVVGLGGKIYVMGGTDTEGDGGRDDRNVAFDTATSSFSLKAPIPAPARKKSVAVAYGGKIYLIGGMAQSEGGQAYLGVLQQMDIYDPQTDSWTSGPAMLNPILEPLAAVVGNKLYIFGKEVNKYGYDTQAIHEFDFSTGVWTLMQYLYPPYYYNSIYDFNFQGGSVTVLDGKIYFLKSGHFGIYDPAANEWTSPSSGDGMPPFPAYQPGPIWGHDGKIYSFGGLETSYTLANKIRSFDPLRRVWSEESPLLRGRRRAKVIPMGDRLFVVGGFCSESIPENVFGPVQQQFCDDGEIYPVP
ncbi:MAG: hypothetical protein ABI036_16865 [Fibrobacteria bacterium]